MIKSIQTKDIPTRPILELLLDRQPDKENPNEFIWTFRYWTKDLELFPCIDAAFPCGTPEKLKRAKLQNLINKKYISGCACGCRGDFAITKIGIEWLNDPFNQGPSDD